MDLSERVPTRDASYACGAATATFRLQRRPDVNLISFYYNYIRLDKALL